MTPISVDERMPTEDDPYVLWIRWLKHTPIVFAGVGPRDEPHILIPAGRITGKSERWHATEEHPATHWLPLSVLEVRRDDLEAAVPNGEAGEPPAA